MKVIYIYIQCFISLLYYAQLLKSTRVSVRYFSSSFRISLISFCYVVFPFFPDEYTLAENSTVVISTDDIVHTLPCELSPSSFPTLTFDAPSGFRVKFEFLQFGFASRDDYLEIGDGYKPGKRTRLARFSGTENPVTDITSVSNAAWIKIKTLCRRKMFHFSMTISAENNIGKYLFSEFVIVTQEDWLVHKNKTICRRIKMYRTYTF